MFSKFLSRSALLFVSLGVTSFSYAAGIGGQQFNLIDFTEQTWQAAILAGPGGSATVGDVTLTANIGNLTFNANENGGCLGSKLAHGLACDGDGIGINDDQISDGGVQTITVSFAKAVDIFSVDSLNLFADENAGEAAVMSVPGGPSVESVASANNFGVSGGYWRENLGLFGVTQLVLSARDDLFSDFSLARIGYLPSASSAVSVSEPSSLILLGLGLFGTLAARKKVRMLKL